MRYLLLDAASKSITTAQHANTIELEGIIIGLVCIVIGGLYKLGKDVHKTAEASGRELGGIHAMLKDLEARLERVEQKADSELKAQQDERRRVQLNTARRPR